MDCKQHATFRAQSATLPPHPPPILVTKVTCFCEEPCEACPPPKKASWFFFARYLSLRSKVPGFFCPLPQHSQNKFLVFFARYLKALFLEPGFFVARYLPKGRFPSYLLPPTHPPTPHPPPPNPPPPPPPPTPHPPLPTPHSPPPTPHPTPPSNPHRGQKEINYNNN